MKINSKFVNDNNVERLKRLPEPFISAMETIVDQLDKDWRNKIVTEKYISELCDMFEEAIKEGKTVRDVCGDDVVAFGKKYQSERDYREIEASANDKIINRLLCYNLLLILSPYVKGFDFTNIMNLILLGIGFIALIVYFYLKTKLFREANLNLVFVILQTIVAIVLPYILPIHVFIVFFLVSISDYAYVWLANGKNKNI